MARSFDKIIILLLLSASLSVDAQITIVEHLKSAENGSRLATLRKKADYLDGSPYKLSPLNKIEFRTQNDRLIADEQEYALRLNPTNPWEIKNTRRLFEAEKILVGIEEQLVFKEILNDRYQEVLDYIYLHELSILQAKQSDLIKKEESVQLQRSGSDSFDAGDLIDIKLDYINQLIVATEIDANLSQIRAEITEVHSGQGPSDWSYSTIINIDGVENFISQGEQGSVMSSEVSLRESRVHLAKRDIDLEQSKKNIGFVQGAFDGSRSNGEKVGLSLGIVLPVVNPNKADVAEAKLDLIEEEGKLEEEKLQSATQRLLRFEKLKGDINRIRSLQKDIDNVSNTDYLKTLQLADGYNPLSTLRVKKGLLKLEILRIKMLRSMMDSYLDYLFYEDLLQARPLVNYLDPLLGEM